jgi:hypothetical protein
MATFGIPPERVPEDFLRDLSDRPVAPVHHGAQPNRLLAAQSGCSVATLKGTYGLTYSGSAWLFRHHWVVYSKPPFGGPQHVLRYLGAYTHRVAISNSRLVALADGNVTFRWRDSASPRGLVSKMRRCTAAVRLDDPRTTRVCLIARSVSSDVLGEGDLGKLVQSDMAALFGAFSERLNSAKDTGELPPEFEPEVVAQIIGTYLQGLFRTALLCYDRLQLERQVDLFLISIGL